MNFSAFVLATLAIGTSLSVRAQDHDAFESLSVPPKSVGTCQSGYAVRNEAQMGKGARRVHLVIAAIEPTRRRELIAFIDKGKPVLFSEMIFRSTGILSSSDDHVLARFDSLGRATGFHSHGTIQFPDSAPRKLDTAFLRRMGENAVSKNSREPLDKGSAHKVETLAAWLRTRCPANTK